MPEKLLIVALQLIDFKSISDFIERSIRSLMSSICQRLCIAIITSKQRLLVIKQAKNRKYFHCNFFWATSIEC